MVIMAMESRETPMLPYLMKGKRVHRNIPWTQVPCRNRDALNGKTITQNCKSATHRLSKNTGNFNLGVIGRREDWPDDEHGGYIS